MVLLSDPGASRSLTNHDNSSSDVDDYIDEKSVSSDSTSYCSIQSPSFSNDIAHVVKIKIISGSLKRESHLDLAIEGSLRSNSKTGDEVCLIVSNLMDQVSLLSGVINSHYSVCETLQ